MKDPPGRKDRCLPKLPSGFCKRTDSRFQRCAEQRLGGRVSREVLRSSKHRVGEQKAWEALPGVNLTRTGARPDHLSLTVYPLPPSASAFSEETAPPLGPGQLPGQVWGLWSTGYDRWPPPSQLLKWEQVGGCRFLFPFGLLRALWLLLLFSLSVLGPGGSQDPGRFCLRAGPLLFIRREPTSRMCLGSDCLTLEREGQWRGRAGPGQRSGGREPRQGQ